MWLLLKHIIIGSGVRPARFHDEQANLVKPAGFTYVANSLTITFLRRRFGYRPAMPWQSYRARRHVVGLLCSDWTILEFESGMSAICFEQPCSLSYSIEHNPAWYGIVQVHVSRKKIYNVIYMLRDQETCPDLSKFPDNSFDFALINGIRRTNCVQNVLSKVKPGGWVYLDNTEMKSRTKVGNDYQQAEQLSPSFTLPGKGLVKYFIGLVSTNFVAKQEMHVNFEFN